MFDQNDNKVESKKEFSNMLAYLLIKLGESEDATETMKLVGISAKLEQLTSSLMEKFSESQDLTTSDKDSIKGIADSLYEIANS